MPYINRYVSVDEKICRTCKEAKHISQFNKHYETKDRLRTNCKVCQTEQGRIWTQRQKEKEWLPSDSRRCNSCNQVKEAKEFSRPGVDWICRPCEKIRSNNWSETRRSEEYIERKYRARKRLFADLAGGCCQRCGYNEFQIGLEFHHVNKQDKVAKPSSLTHRNFDKAYQELDKCVLICRNCHMALEKNYWTAEFVKRDGLGYTLK